MDDIVLLACNDNVRQILRVATPESSGNNRADHPIGYLSVRVSEE